MSNGKLLPEFSPANTTIVLDLHGVVFCLSCAEVMYELLRAPRKYYFVPLLFNISLWYTAFKALYQKQVVEQLLEQLAYKYSSFARVHKTALKVINAQKPSAPMVTLLQQLRAQQYRLVVFSNIGACSMACLKERYPQVFDLFDVVVYTSSCDQYIAKPSSKAFDKLFDALEGCKTAHYIFIDDTAVNLVQANLCGMHTIKFVSAHKLKQCLKQWHVL